MEALLLAILGVLKFFWDAIITVVYFFNGIFEIFGILFKPISFIANFVINALPNTSTIQSATSTISLVAEDAQSFFSMIVPSFVWAGIYGLMVVVMLIGAIKMFKKT